MLVFVNFKIDLKKKQNTLGLQLDVVNNGIDWLKELGLTASSLLVLTLWQTFFGLSLLGDANSGISPIDSLLVKKEVKN